MQSLSPLTLHPVILLCTSHWAIDTARETEICTVQWGERIFRCIRGNLPFSLSLTQAEAGSSGEVKVRVTKYNVGGGVAAGAVTGGNDDEGGVKVKELGEGDPQWHQIQEVVREQLERAGIKAEGRPEHTPAHTLKYSCLPVCVFVSGAKT